MTHGELDTFPRTADMLGYCTPAQAVDVAEKVVTVQRDWGNRELRKNARLKYTIEKHGIDKFRAEVEKRLGIKLGKAKPFKFASTGDPIGWRETLDGKAADKTWHLTLFIENGRIKDTPQMKLRTAIREIAELGGVSFVVTSNQNLIIANVAAALKPKIEAILKSHGVAIATTSGLRRNSMACVALPTCGLALAESERFLPELITALEETLESAGLRDDEIVVRMTGCPNGCARPYLAEIGFVGRNPGLYNLYLGAAFDGTRLSKLYAQDVDKAKILKLLDPIIRKYAKERKPGEHFGDFVIRAGIIKATPAGNKFHDGVTLAAAE
jgi:sulfite reductase (NADPH) hemoprotein beta-component